VKTALLILLNLSAAPTLAAKATAVLPADIGDLSTLDEVVVTGERSLSAARMAIIEAEDRFYARWNSLNDDRRFDIHCREETPRDHHSRITRRICEPGFVDQAEQVTAERAMLEMQGGMSGDGRTVQVGSTAPQMMLMRQELRKRTLAMLEKDPELARALVERARLAQHFDELRREKFKDRWIHWK
jgi:hypothetical protein